MATAPKSEKAIKIIDKQLKELAGIAISAKSSGDTRLGFERLHRWKARTVSLLSENIHPNEGRKLQDTKTPSYMTYGIILDNLLEAVHIYSVFLGSLREELKRYPEYILDVPTSLVEEVMAIKTPQPTSKREPKATMSVSPESIFREVSPSVFISHGKESVALRKLKEFIETLGIEPLIVKEQASLDKDLPDKVNSYLNQADFVIILATGDDTVKDKKSGAEVIQPRQNVIHEIGLAQKAHPGRVIYLLEEGANFPSNIRPKVWESFKQRNMMNAFLGIVRELRAYGMLKVIKYPVE
jgi:predicted nucleotide-binding protein